MFETWGKVNRRRSWGRPEEVLVPTIADLEFWPYRLRKRLKCRYGRSPTAAFQKSGKLLLTLQKDWLRHVYARGLAVIGATRCYTFVEAFVLGAYPVVWPQPPLAGADLAVRVVYLTCMEEDPYFSSRMKVVNCYGYLVKHGGRYAINPTSPADALAELSQLVLWELGVEEHPLPF